MGKKEPKSKAVASKKSKQEPQAQNNPDHQDEHIQMQQKSKSKTTSKTNVFSQNFLKSLEAFKLLFRQYANLKVTKEGVNQRDFLIQASQRIASNVENQAAQLFKNELTQLQKWITSQVDTINNQIKNIEKAYQLNRQSLLKTGVFSEQQIRGQLSSIQAKAADKKNTRQKYQTLLQKSKEFYQAK